MSDKIHIKDRNLEENKNKKMDERGWTAGTVTLAVLAFLFCGIVGGIIYVVMKNKTLKQKNRLVYDHNAKIINNKKAKRSKDDVNKKKQKNIN